jgi:ferredoxin-fold anticodon binding domain-containing protein
MSRGWESKSVEQQQAQRQAEQQGDPDKVAPADAVLQEAERKRKVQALQLQRERVLSERTSSPHRRTALTNALADIEEKLTELGWTIHL